MSHWISVYTDELDELKKIVRSRNLEAAEKAIQRYQQKAGSHAKESTIAAIRRLVEGAYESGEQPDGHTVIYAFEHLCRTYAQEAETVEIYVDEDKFPEIFDFVWKSENDPFMLPLSKNGSPACTHWNNAQAKRYLQLFQRLDMERLSERTDSDYSGEVEALCRVLAAASERGQGVFVFYNE